MQSPRRRGWLEELIVDLEALGVATRLSAVHRAPRPLGDRMLPGGSYDLLRTLNYAELVSLHQRWYPAGIKVVPQDIRLTPTVVCHWFCGDGRGGDRKGTLGLCTDGFSANDVKRLRDLLHMDLGVEALVTFNHRNHPQILVSRRGEAVKLKQAIHALTPQCCLYKFNHVRPLQEVGRGRRLSAALKERIQRAKGSGQTMRAVAQDHRVSVSKVWHLWHTS